ncbi:MAG: oxidoreductase, partial [Chloroflexi bacterium]|nr:oxidoreductase [Chloroflexota bacterium]
MTSSEPAKVALVGCGAVAEVLHAPTLRALVTEALVEVVALVDPNPARTAQVGRLLPQAR